jgi:tetratricopeptide (TPR) repeat protein
MKYLVFILSLVLLTGPSPARAQSPLKRELARRHYKLGETYYKTSDYPRALEHFKKAYAAEPHHALLYNIARCHEVMAQLELAIENYRRYLQHAEDPERRETVRQRIEVLRQRLERQPAPPASQPAPPASQPAPAASQPASATIQPAPQPSPQPAPPPAPGQRPGAWRRTAGWVTLGLGGASLVTGLVFGGLASAEASDYRDAVDRGRTYTELQQIQDRGERYETVQLAALILGGVLVAGGAGLVIWDLLDQRRRMEAPARTGARVSLAPVLSADLLGLAARGSF